MGFLYLIIIGPLVMGLPRWSSFWPCFGCASALSGGPMIFVWGARILISSLILRANGGFSCGFYGWTHNFQSIFWNAPWFKGCGCTRVVVPGSTPVYTPPQIDAVLEVASIWKECNHDDPGASPCWTHPPVVWMSRYRVDRLCVVDKMLTN